MDMYKTTSPCLAIDEVDLDDLNTYPEYWLKMSASELREKCDKDMGFLRVNKNLRKNKIFL